jgi:hypothetical protein
VRVAFAKDGVAFTQAGDGTLLGNVVDAVGCHVGFESDEERAAVDVARDDVARGDVMSLDDAKVDLAGGVKDEP